jgi:hypothetical protein
MSRNHSSGKDAATEKGTWKKDDYFEGYPKAQLELLKPAEDNPLYYANRSRPVNSESSIAAGNLQHSQGTPAAATSATQTSQSNTSAEQSVARDALPFIFESVDSDDAKKASIAETYRRATEQKSQCQQSQFEGESTGKPWFQ